MTSGPVGESLPTATRLIAVMGERGVTVACAESLTGGLVAAALIAPPGASAVVRGGVVAYATPLKHEVLGVSQELLDRGGAVQEQVAAQMAIGVRLVLGSTYGMATTGVAGPDPQDGAPVGRAYVAVAGPDEVRTRRLDLPGDRLQVRTGCVREVLDLLAEVLAEPTD